MADRVTDELLNVADLCRVLRQDYRARAYKYMQPSLRDLGSNEVAYSAESISVSVPLLVEIFEQLDYLDKVIEEG